MTSIPARAGRGATAVLVQRDNATLATSVLAAHAGAWGVRVHDVAASVDAVRVVAAVAAGAPAQKTLALTAPARKHRPTDGHTERWRSA